MGESEDLEPTSSEQPTPAEAGAKPPLTAADTKDGLLVDVTGGSLEWLLGQDPEGPLAESLRRIDAQMDNANPTAGFADGIA